MLRLLQIELKKMINYRTFWVILGLYCLLLETTVYSIIKFSKKLVENKAMGEIDNISAISLHNFPDIWGNIAYISGFFKIILGFIVIISISNEFTYRTGRQNIIDGLSREQFFCSKMLANLLLSILSAAMVFFTILLLGVAYNPGTAVVNIFAESKIIFAYWLEIFSFLSFALFLGIWIPRAGLAILFLISSPLIESIMVMLFDSSSSITPQSFSIISSWINPYLPLGSMGRLVEMPFFKFNPFTAPSVPDVLLFLTDVSPIIIVLVWVCVFNYMGYLKFRKPDI